MPRLQMAGDGSTSLVLAVLGGIGDVRIVVGASPRLKGVLDSDLPTVQTSPKIMFRRGLKTVKTGTQMCEI
jgi:hypothetical protein